MSHKNKRYVLYVAGNWVYGSYGRQLIDRKVSWARYTFTRANLVNQIARYCRYDTVKFTADKDSVTVDQLRSYVLSSNPPRPGVKHWDVVKITWCCVKIIRDGKEVDVNLDSLLKEIKDCNVKHYSPFRVRRCKWCTPWKQQYKCRKQYEIHIPKHIDTYK